MDAARQEITVEAVQKELMAPYYNKSQIVDEEDKQIHIEHAVRSVAGFDLLNAQAQE